MKTIKLYTSLLFLLINSLSFAQQFQVLDAYSKEVVPFAKVIPSIDKPLLTDMDGKFQLNVAEQEITIKVNTYRDTTLKIYSWSDVQILLRPAVQNIQEVTVLPGENPAERIIKKAIENRKLNHPLENDGFISHQYSKFIFDIDSETRKRLMDSSVLKKGDTTLLKMRNFFGKQYLFMIENASRHYFEPPYKEKEIIEAYKVSGFTDPIFSTFAQEMQSFHFYDNQVSVLGKQYINPIAFGALNRYLFVLEDSTFNVKDTTYTIFYRPRKGKNFEGLTGRLYINTNGFAIEKVTAKPYVMDTSGMALEIVQEYAFTENTKWFPSKLSTSIEIYTAIADVESGTVSVVAGGEKVTKPKSYIVGKGSTYIDKVQFNPKELEKEKFNNVSTETAVNAESAGDSKWDELRNNQLSEREKNTYTNLDSIVKTQKLDRFLALAKVLASGKIPVKYFNLDLKRIINFNSYEGYRLGLGIETSERLIKPLILGTYFGYGTKDKAWKYGAYSHLFLHRRTGTKLELFIQNDVAEVGSVRSIANPNFLTNDLAREFFIKNKVNQEKMGIAFQTYIRSNMGLRLEANTQRLFYGNTYQFEGKNAFVANETSLIWSWNIREKVNILGNQRVSMGTKFPKLQLQIDKGWKLDAGKFSSNLDYYRLIFQIQQTVPIIGIGKLAWSLKTGISDGNAPLFFHQLVSATRANWSISVPNTFETVDANEFYHKKAAAIFTRFIFNSKHTKAKWNEPQLGLHYAYGIGEFQNKEAHSLAFRSMDKGLHEAGLFLNGILVSGNSSIGLGGFTRFGYYANPDWKRNIVPKIVVGVVF
jgi:hypothetical protein